MDMKLFSEKEIIETYNNYVLKDIDYFTKVTREYSKLSDEEKIKLNENTCCRACSIFDFKEWIKKYNISSVENLLITCWDDIELNYISANNITISHYDSNKENDLHRINLDFKNYDFIIFNQTLEHLYNPFIVMKNLYDHLKPGGYLYTTVPTINTPHVLPFHFWGITPIGLCMLSKSVGFNILECGFWGNLEYVNTILNTGDWPKLEEVFNSCEKLDINSLGQSQTWVLVQK